MQDAITSASITDAPATILGTETVFTVASSDGTDPLYSIDFGDGTSDLNVTLPGLLVQLLLYHNVRGTSLLCVHQNKSDQIRVGTVS